MAISAAKRRVMPKTFDADAVVYFSACATLGESVDLARKNLFHTFLLGWKTSGAWAKTDVAWLDAAHGPSSKNLNLKNPSTFTAVLSPTNTSGFTVNRGVLGNSTNIYIAQGWAPNNGVQFQQNSAHVGLYINIVGSGKVITGRSTASSPVFFQVDAAQMRLNSSAIIAPGGGLSSPGWIVADRANGTTAEVRVNGSQVNSTALASTALDSSVLNTLRASTTYGNSEVAFESRGASIAAEDAAFYSVLLPFLTAIGAN